MSNSQQNEIKNEIEQIKTEINLLQDKLKQSKKKKLLQNGLKRIAKMQTKKRQNRLKQIAKTKSFTNQKKDKIYFKLQKCRKYFKMK